MPLPFLPPLLNPADYKPALTPGTYSDLVAETLGNLGDPSDGTEARIIELAAVTGGFENRLGLSGADVLQIAPQAEAFAGDPVGDIQAQFQPVADSIDASLAAFDGTVLPISAPAPPVGVPPAPGAVVGQPSVVFADDFQQWTCDLKLVALAMRVGAPVQVLRVPFNAFGGNVVVYDQALVYAGNTLIFSGVVSAAPPILFFKRQADALIDISPALAGHFTALIRLHATGDVTGFRYVCVVVDILP